MAKKSIIDIKDVFPSMGRFLKGFPKNIGPMLKEPVTSMEKLEARRADVLGMLYFFILFTVVVGILCCLPVVGEIASMLTILPVAGLLFSIFLLAVLHDAQKRMEVLTCPKCKTMVDTLTTDEFARYVSYAVVKDEASYKYRGNSEPTNGVYSVVGFTAVAKAVVDVSLTCPHCGDVRQLLFKADPMNCENEEKDVSVLDYRDVRRALEEDIRAVVEEYNDPARKAGVPYSFHSSKNPNYENRTTFKGANSEGATPKYKGVRITFRKDVSEMLEHYFVERNLTGVLMDPGKKK